MIEVKNLTKSFNERIALNNIDFKIEEGGILGLIGANGAGKSTLLRIISGVLQADDGYVSFDGKSLNDDPEIKNGIFFFPDELYFSVGQSVYDIAKFYSIFYKDFDISIFKRLCEEFEIDLKTKVNSLSKGVKRQVMMSAAASAKPRFLILDESFDGIDTVAKETLKNILKRLSQKYKTTVIISSHNIKEIEDICEELVLLYKSKMIVNKKISELKSGNNAEKSLEDILKNELEVQGYVAKTVDFL